MTNITIYSKDYCPYCISAKALLSRKGASFTEIDVLENPDQLAVMIERSGGRRTVPQIFIGDQHIGGFSDLDALNSAGKLDLLLKVAA